MPSHCTGLSVLLLACLATPSSAPRARDCTVYLYLDDDGASHRTRKLQEVPESKREAMITYQDCRKNFREGGSFAYVGRSKTQEEAARTVRSDQADEGVWAWFKRKHRNLRDWRGFLACIAAAVALAGLIGLVVAAFQTHLAWGLAVLLLPVVPVFFAVLHWKRAWNALLVWLAGWSALIVTVYVV